MAHPLGSFFTFFVETSFNYYSRERLKSDVDLTFALTLPVWITVTLAMTLVALEWTSRTLPIRAPFIFLMVGIAMFTVGYLGEILSSDMGTMAAWNLLEMSVFIVLPSLFLIFVVAYLGRNDILSRKRMFFLFLVPAALLTLLWHADTLDGLILSSPAVTLRPIPLPLRILQQAMLLVVPHLSLSLPSDKHQVCSDPVTGTCQISNITIILDVGYISVLHGWLIFIGCTILGATLLTLLIKAPLPLN